MDIEYAIRLENISRRFSNKNAHVNNLALKNVSFNVKRGTIHGLIGPNGAGKSTTMKILSTLLLPSSGHAYINNLEISQNLLATRKLINFVYGGERDLYWRLSGVDNLKYFAALYNLDRTKQDQMIKHLLDLVGLSAAKDRLVETYSKGMKQRLQIARGLLNNPQVLLLDEPTIGLDQESSEVFKKIIQRLINDGTSILFTSHYLEEIEDLCDSITILNHGEVVANGTPDELRQAFITDLQFKIVIGGKVENFAEIMPDALVKKAFQLKYSYRIQSDLTEVSGILSGQKYDLANQFIDQIRELDKVRKFELTTPSLDHIYKYYTTDTRK